MKTLTTIFEDFFQLKPHPERKFFTRLDTLRQRRSKAERLYDRYRLNSKENNPLKAVQARFIIKGLNEQINAIQCTSS